MTNKLSFGLLVLITSPLLAAAISVAGFSLIAPIKPYIKALAQSSEPAAPDALILNDEQGEYPLGRYLDILEDPTGELTIADITSPEYASRFIRSEVNIPNFGYTNSVYWLRLSVINETGLTSRWFLETVFQNLNFVDLYIPSQGGEFLKKESGALRPFNTRDIPYHHIVFELPLASQGEQTVYLRVESGSSMTLSFILWSPESFAVNKIGNMLWNGLFYGALLMALGYHLFLLFSLKEVNYFYFSLCLAGSILFFATYEGITDQYLWPGLSQEKRYFLVITMALFFIASLKFSDIFLEQNTRTPRFHRLSNILMGIWGLMIVMVPFTSYGFMAQLTSVLLLLTPLLIAVAGFYSRKKGYTPARFYLISWLGYILGIIIVELVRLDALPSNIFTEKSYQIGLIWLALLSSFALAERIKMLKAQTEDANRLLRSSESRLSQILEGLPLGVVVYGKDQKPSYINQRTIDILSNPSRGIQPDTSAGRTLAQAMDYFSFRISGSDQAYPLENMPIARALQGELASADDLEADLVDRRVPLEIWANPIKDDLGNVETVVVAFQDVTSRKQAQAELNEYRNHLEMLVEQRTAELSAINDQLNQEVVERKLLEEILQNRVEWLSAVNRVHQRISSTEDLPDAFRQLSVTILKLLEAKSVFIGLRKDNSEQIDILSYLTPDGSPQAYSDAIFDHKNSPSLFMEIEAGKLIILPADQATGLIALQEGGFQFEDLNTIVLAPLMIRQKITGLLGMGFQLTQQAVPPDMVSLIERIAIDLAYLDEEARLMVKAQASAASEERSRLARDLHDSVTQVLFSASLVAEVLPQIWRRNPDMAQKSLEELRRLNRGALAEMRTMLLELRPSSLTKTPLGELLAQLTEATTARSGVSFQLFIEQIPKLPEEIHTSFYRIAQEGLNNVVKHAQASLVTVSLSATQDHSTTGNGWRGEVKLIIRDDGVGFTTQGRATEHMGIGIIRERAAAINAAVSINSQPGYGTVLILAWHNLANSR